MDERRFRVALDTIEETIKDFGEETIFAALGVIAERFGWELAKRDPGPECEYDDWYNREGILAPLHACPHDAPAPDEQRHALGKGLLFEDPIDLAHRAFSIPRRWS